jgi:hypothetical protein
MDFEEKIDAMRMTLELAIHDIEAQRADTESLRGSIRELREASEVLMKATQALLATAQNHEGRIQGLEHRA